MSMDESYYNADDLKIEYNYEYVKISISRHIGDESITISQDDLPKVIGLLNEAHANRWGKK